MQVNKYDHKDWEHFSKKYNSKNPISKLLISYFFKCIKKIIDFNTKENKKILEVGCGTAISSIKIFKNLPSNTHFEASEFEESIVNILKTKKLPFVINQESIYSLNRPNNSFDTIFCLEVLEHLEQPDLALTELFRVTKKHVIISVPNEPLWRILNMARGSYLKNFGNTPGHVNHWNKKSLKLFIEMHGGIIKKIYNPIPWLIFLVEVPK